MMVGTKDTSKVAVSLRIAPATLAQVDDLLAWLGAPSKNWVWEHAIERWHAQEQERQGAKVAEASELPGQVQCPLCRGTGEIIEYNRDGFSATDVTCTMCNGTRKVDLERAVEWREAMGALLES